MPSDLGWVAEGSPAETSLPVATVLRPSTDKTTTTTADPGSGGTTLAVTANALFPSTNGFKVRVMGTSGIPEIMLVTAGAGTNSWTVTRGQDGTTGVAHSSGASVWLMEAVQVVTNENARKVISYKGRVSTFRTPARVATAQNFFAIHNATGSTVLVDVEKITIDWINAAAAGVAPTVIPGIVRAYRFTAVPTNGTALTKVPEDTALASNSAVTVWGDASADGTGSGTTLTVTPTAGNILTQEYVSRTLVVGTSASTFIELMDRATFFEDEGVAITLRPLEGFLIRLDSAANQVVTNHMIVGCRWTEYRVV
jgi:hypothetical protein